MRQQTLFAGNGIMDSRTLVNTGSMAVWANSTGVYMTDGQSPINLTDQGQISRYWQENVSGFSTAAGWSAVAGLYQNWYIISVCNASGTLVISLACNLQTRRWISLGNIDASCMARRAGGAGYTEELFFGRYAEFRVGKLGSIFLPTVTNPNDADGTSILPYIETPFYRLSGGSTDRFQNVYVQYDLRSTDGTPNLQVGFITSPEETEYTPSTRTLPATTQQERGVADIRRAARGVGFKIAQSSSSYDTRIYGLEIEGNPRFEKR